MADLQKLNRTIDELEKQSNSLREFNEVVVEIKRLKKEVSENLNLLKINNEKLENLRASIKIDSENLLKDFKKFENEVSSGIHEQYEDSKRFQKEFDYSITSRLDRNKSDIQVEIRNEGVQLQRSLEVFICNELGKFKQITEDSFKKIKTDLKWIKILSAIGLATLMAIGTAILYFLMA